MSEINCPQCGRVISDTVRWCPKCRFPVGKFIDKSFADMDSHSYVMDEKQFNALRSDFAVYVPKHRRLTEKNRKLLYTVISVILVLTFGIGVLLYYVDTLNSRYEMQTLNVSTLTAGRMMKLNGDYIIYLKSNETQPFIAVYYDNERQTPNYVFMSEGRGMLRFSQEELLTASEEELASINEDRFFLRGYINGFSLSDRDVSGSNKIKLSDMGRSSGAVLTLKGNITGMLFYSIEGEGGTVILEHCIVPVFEGTANLRYAYFGRDFQGSAVVKPYYFVPVEHLDESDYHTDGFDIEYIRYRTEDITGYSTSVGKRQQYSENYKIFGTVSLPDKENGFLLYQYEIDGNNTISSGGLCLSDNNEYSIVTNDLTITRETEKKQPGFTVTIRGWIPILQSGKS